jgi:hypothetical protein
MASDFFTDDEFGYLVTRRWRLALVRLRYRRWR